MATSRGPIPPRWRSAPCSARGVRRRARRLPLPALAGASATKRRRATPARPPNAPPRTLSPSACSPRRCCDGVPGGPAAPFPPEVDELQTRRGDELGRAARKAAPEFDLWHGAVTRRSNISPPPRQGSHPPRCSTRRWLDNRSPGPILQVPRQRRITQTQSLVMVALVLSLVACPRRPRDKFCCVGRRREPAAPAPPATRTPPICPRRLRAAGGQLGNRLAGATNYKFAMKDAFLDLAEERAKASPSPAAPPAPAALCAVAGSFGSHRRRARRGPAPPRRRRAGASMATSSAAPFTLGGVKIDLEQGTVRARRRRVDLVYAPLAGLVQPRRAPRSQRPPSPRPRLLSPPRRSTRRGVMAFLAQGHAAPPSRC